MVIEGDLVEVVYLPQMMYHFKVSVGVVARKSGKSFFIHWVNKKGKLIKDSISGWYEEGNVRVIVPGYKRGVLDGKVVYRDLEGLSVLLSKAFKRTESISVKYVEKEKIFWQDF